MTSHRLQVTVAPVDGAVCVTHSRTDGNGRQQTKLVVLDKDFVEAVREAYLRLDLTRVTDIVSATWLDLPNFAGYREATLVQIETTLIYLAEQDKILLPFGDE